MNLFVNLHNKASTATQNLNIVSKKNGNLKSSLHILQPDCNQSRFWCYRRWSTLTENFRWNWLGSISQV